eukprot:TRINITY_DN1070_c0_g1_i3.p1 TRINITY_DN1070_c0_g1~~TRINITY_DN1070_c0_g1_i3.p1  ORF type:complete len:273 (+),score=61.89 TRINITY_DN1070_c0_g1_i3:56-874(+)
MAQSHASQVDYWDSFSNQFQRVNEPFTLPLSTQLMSAVNIFNAKKILEVACGAGLATKVCDFLKPADATLTAIDFSPAMINLAKITLEGKDVKFVVASAESLPFGDNEFDKYFASLALNLVNDADKMLDEAYRVLEKGGTAAFSIWGRPEHSRYTPIMPKVLKEFDIDLYKGAPPPRSNYYLGGDLNALRELLQKHGFTNVIAWYHPLIYLPESGAQFAQWIQSSPQYIPLFSELSPELKQQVIDRASALADEIIQRGEPLTLDCAVVIGKK